MSVPNPIADLSYRNYDGPKSLGGARWWAIARNGIRGATRKKFFWVLVALATLPYLLLIMQMIAFSTMAARSVEMRRNLPEFLELLAGAYGNTWWVMFVALLIGTGSIAADNRANALQVYLSKPITKRDYLVGKLMSVFIPVYVVTLVPMLLAVAYAAFDQGLASFFGKHPFIVLQVFVVAAIPASVHSALLCGISAWNQLPWVVGVIYVSIFMFWQGASSILALVIRHQVGAEAAVTMRFFSIDGAISGLGYRILGSMPPEPFRPIRGVFPDPLVLSALLALFILLGVYLCYARIRAVEVVSG